MSKYCLSKEELNEIEERFEVMQAAEYLDRVADGYASKGHNISATAIRQAAVILRDGKYKDERFSLSHIACPSSSSIKLP